MNMNHLSLIFNTSRSGREYITGRRFVRSKITFLKSDGKYEVQPYPLSVVCTPYTARTNFDGFDTLLAI